MLSRHPARAMLSELGACIERAVKEAGYAGISAVMAIETVSAASVELVLPSAGSLAARLPSGAHYNRIEPVVGRPC